LSYKKSNQLKVLHGTDQPCRTNSVIKGDKDLPDIFHAPKNLNEHGKEMYRELCKSLKKLNLLKRTDLQSLEMCADAYGEYIECNLQIKKLGGIAEYVSGKTSQQIPLVTARNAAADRYRKFIIDFGLSPAARNKLGVVEQDEEDAFTTFLKKV